MSEPVYDPNELVRAGDTESAKLRCFAHHILPKTIRRGTGTLAVLTPMAFHTGLQMWVPWDDGGSSGETVVSAFVWPDPIVLVASKEVIGNLCTAGIIHFADIVVLAGNTSANLKTALRDDDVRKLGFTIQGLTKVQ